MEQVFGLISETPKSSAIVLVKNAGCFGEDSLRVSFESIETTFGMVGLSFA